MLTGVKRDTKIARLIKSTSSAALSVVGGMVHTATLAGPYRPLATAGGTLIEGLQGILDTPDEKMRIFDPAGLEVNLRDHQLAGAETYVLLHRGADTRQEGARGQQRGTGGGPDLYGGDNP